MPQTGVTPHPQKARQKADDNRNPAESELWDDNSGILWYFEDDPDVVLAALATHDVDVEVYLRVAGRLEIDVNARVEWPGDIDGAAQARLYVDGVESNIIGPYRNCEVRLEGVTGATQNVIADIYAMAVEDVTAGKHTVRLQISAGTTNTYNFRCYQLKVRGARRPPA